VVLVFGLNVLLITGEERGRKGGSNRRTRYEQQEEEATGATVPYRTATGGRMGEGGSYAKPERERESSEGQDRAIRILQQRKREKRGRGERKVEQVHRCPPLLLLMMFLNDEHLACLHFFLTLLLDHVQHQKQSHHPPQ
jgi:hypothetical protein